MSADTLGATDILFHQELTAYYMRMEEVSSPSADSEISRGRGEYIPRGTGCSRSGVCIHCQLICRPLTNTTVAPIATAVAIATPPPVSELGIVKKEDRHYWSRSDWPEPELPWHLMFGMLQERSMIWHEGGKGYWTE
ncbi:hypothetical protein Hte_002936 [Hypoxylon texense]